MAETTKQLSLKQLKEYHDKYGGRTAGPKYDFVRTLSGFTATCEYREFKTSGHGTSKVSAQREAAFEMLRQLPNRTTVSQSRGIPPGNQPVENHTEELQLTLQQIEKIRSFVERNKASVDICRNFKAEDEKSESPLNDVNVGLKETLSPKSETLSSGIYRRMDVIESFERVMEEMNLQFYCELPNIKSGKIHCVAMLKINFNGLVIAGLGQTVEKAVFKACQNGLDMLDILMK